MRGSKRAHPPPATTKGEKKARVSAASPPPYPLDPTGTYLMAHPFHFTRYSMRP